MREEEEADDGEPTHLSGLKGVLFSLGIRDLRPWKDAERTYIGNRNGIGNVSGGHADSAPADPEQTIAAKAFVPQPEQEPAEAKAEKPPSLSVVPRWVTAEPEFLSPPVEESNKGKESRWNRKGYDTDDLDGIQILPAKRGQYKR